MNKAVTVTILNDDEMPAAGAYLAGSASDGEAIVKLNLGLMALSGVDGGREQFDRAFAETLAHELFHVCQELCGKVFSEAEVEGAIARATEHLAENPDCVTSSDVIESHGALRDRIIELERELAEARAA